MPSSSTSMPSPSPPPCCSLHSISCTPRQHTQTAPPGSCPPHLSRLAPGTCQLPPSTRPLDSHPGPTHTGTQPTQLQPRHVQRPLPIQRRNRPHPHLRHHRNNSPN